MTWLYGVTLFLSAFLVFSVQPMVGRMVLPLLGGVPSVWNTCMVFFQATLLAGYAYAHVGLTRLGPVPQWRIHLLVLGGGLVFLPPAISASRVDALWAGAGPVGWLVGTLSLMLAVPLTALSATAPTLIRWFSRTRHAEASDPHFLYVASNLGSFVALLAYPLVVEPELGLRAQAQCWAWGYGLLALLVIACGWAAGRRPGGETEPGVGVGLRQGEGETREVDPADPAVLPPDRVVPRRGEWRWVGLAAVPSSLVLGVTQFITTDLASIPLFWVVPLAVYLLTFIAAFARRPLIRVAWLDRATPMVMAAVVFLVLTRAADPLWLVLALHLTGLFVGALLCHARLAAERPGPARITRYYLCLALGGVVGGLFNAFAAPWLFRSVVDYPLALVAVCLVRPGRTATTFRAWTLDVALPVLLGVLAVGSMLGARLLVGDSTVLRNAIGIGLPLAIGFAFAARPVRFALGLAVVLWAGWDYARPQGRLLRAERTFFGVTRVTQTPSGEFRVLVHGNTLHGRQWADPAKACEPLAYYHREGPVNDLFLWVAVQRSAPRIGVIGLGAGAMASYARPGEAWVFFEIDPAVIRAAQDTNCFTYLARCAAASWRIVEGDARLQLQRSGPPGFDLLAVDAFSSDAIPVHLLTREALRLYLSRLRPGGLLAFHISNRYLHLAPVLADLAADGGLVCRAWDDWDLQSGESARGKEASEWMVLAREESDLGLLSRLPRWGTVDRGAGRPIWTDDRADLLEALMGSR